MHNNFNKKTNKNEWILDKWYSKTIYVIGIIEVILFILGFFIGLVQ